ncbi:KpsF/GutQ family sugar-phosphate isomerase [Flavitalea sp. BT771]|uniref:KpsF/GutQ family sugar-phosphate isomerase n=1 Tax=Flavitalea sp. BT771 TaxID=3063329 RepID=UPI0026E3B7C6|nr:KpsF/GutQ family sugar-phosphate isomerase [Flavitalea sp. BT771]MDO6434453.1 KpsF/GutQ family sugar-phosphate isomerase [Flavitalea sp. BT771]MDV6223353.1 KpsF/GutQ family sugar-phosphate isomerase [Flavitalea sp. BT771]
MSKGINILETGRNTIRKEAASVAALEELLDGQFEKAVELIFACKGRVIVSGIGKSAIIAQKIVATFNSTGTPAIFLHAADAIHGDLGMVQEQDIVLIISKSGESPEVKMLLSFIRNFGNPLVAMVGNLQSVLAKQASIVLNTTVDQEACLNNLAPTSSTTTQLVMGDALAVTLMEMRGFGSEDFARFHPGGTLGKKLYLRVQDLYIHNERPKVPVSATLREVIMEITSKRLGATAVTDEKGGLLGIVTDGDLRRMLEKNINTDGMTAGTIMTKHPKTVEAEALAIEALDLMRTYDITQLVVTGTTGYMGFIHLHDLIREGII